MFGYVRPALDRLEAADRDAYQGVYCGLCHAMARRHGWPARFTLNYDFAFLAVLLTSGQGEDGTCARRCPAHPFRRPRACLRGAGLETAADESMILTWYKLTDDVQDRGLFAGLPYRALRRLFRRGYRRAAAARPEFDRLVGAGLERLRQMELDRSPRLDQVADCFAAILAAAAEELPQSEERRRIMGQLLYHLGRWIYLVDAADDLEKDFCSGNYNPLICRFGLTEGKLTGEARESLVLSLDHSIRLMAAASELWDFGVWAPIIRATVYEGMFLVGQAVLEGTFQAADKLFSPGGRDEEQL